MQPDNFGLMVRQFKGANDTFAGSAGVFERISEQLVERLQLLSVQPRAVLDLGCRNGYQLGALQKCYPEALVVGVDPIGPGTVNARRWWQRKRPEQPALAGDPHLLPLANESVDLVVSNLFLPWCHDPAAVFSEVVRVLRPNGAFMFTSAGPDTLVEFAALWQQIDEFAHLFGLVDMHNIGDELLAAGLSAPVLDRENITVDYASVDALQIELRNVGAGNIACGRRSGLMADSVRTKLRNLAPEGRFSVTLELVHGHGWKGALPRNRKNSGDEFSVSLDSLRQSLRNG